MKNNQELHRRTKQDDLNTINRLFNLYDALIIEYGIFLDENEYHEHASFSDTVRLLNHIVNSTEKLWKRKEKVEQRNDAPDSPRPKPDTDTENPNQIDETQPEQSQNTQSDEDAETATQQPENGSPEQHNTTQMSKLTEKQRERPPSSREKVQAVAYAALRTVKNIQKLSKYKELHPLNKNKKVAAAYKMPKFTIRLKDNKIIEIAKAKSPAA